MLAAPFERAARFEDAGLLRALPDLLDVGTVERGGSLRELEPVVLDRVVAPRDHEAGVGLRVAHREVQGRRRDLSDVDHRRALVPQPFDDGRADARRREPHVAADRDAALAALRHLLREGAPHGADHLVGQVAVGNASDVVLPEDLRIHGLSLGNRR
jgi:hypothetical protein